jgi:hypothetical protein
VDIMGWWERRELGYKDLLERLVGMPLVSSVLVLGLLLDFATGGSAQYLTLQAQTFGQTLAPVHTILSRSR